AWFGRRNWVAQLAAIDGGRAPRPGHPGQLLDLYLHQLAPYPALCSRLGPQVPGPRAGGGRRAHARVRLRARPRQRPPTGQGPAGRLPGRDRQRLTQLDCPRQPLPRGAYPGAVDNDYAIGSAFSNLYWPALYFADAQGQIRHHRFGEGDYEMSEMVLQQLLTEAGSGGADQDLVSVDPGGVEVAADWDSLRSPENYLGYERTDNFVSPDGSILDTSYAYAAPTQLRLNQWALSGDWTVGRGAIVLNAAGGWLHYRFHPRALPLVMTPPAPDTPARFRVLLDNQPPGPAHGTDIDDQGNGTLTHPRLYQLIRQPTPITERSFQITFLDPAAHPYVFTFGEPPGATTRGARARGFKGRRGPSAGLPPGQYLVEDFPVLSAGPTPGIDLADWELVITSEKIGRAS